MKFVVENHQSISEVLIFLKNSGIGQSHNMVLLKGDLGTGKTTFVKSYIASIGGDASQVDSPTFSLVNTYIVNGKTIYHFDLYRLNSVEEIEDIGFMEYIDSGHLCFIEWPEKMADFLPKDQLIEIEIVVSLNGCREYYIV